MEGIEGWTARERVCVGNIAFRIKPVDLNESMHVKLTFQPSFRVQVVDYLVYVGSQGAGYNPS